MAALIRNGYNGLKLIIIAKEGVDSGVFLD